MEDLVTAPGGIEGVVLRYGGFYGPGASLSAGDGEITELIRRRRFPVVGAGGEAPVVMMTESRGASNAKAERTLGWTPQWPTWREGFVHGL